MSNQTKPDDLSFILLIVYSEYGQVFMVISDMKPIKIIIMLVAFAVGIAASGVSLAAPHGTGGHPSGPPPGGGHFAHPGGGHVGVGVYIGVPLFAPDFYYPPYYYYPPVVTLPAAPPVYIEQGEQQPAQPEAYWYYCVEAKAYYPYVKNCPGGWQRVVPSPPPAQ